MDRIHYTIEVPSNGSAHVVFTRDGDEIGEAKATDVLHVYEGTGRRERVIMLEAGPVSTDDGGERHGADDGGEGWGLRTLPLLPGDEQDPPQVVKDGADRWTVTCDGVSTRFIRNLYGHIVVEQEGKEGGVTALGWKGAQALAHLVNSGQLS